jgi:hypothetical protein
MDADLKQYLEAMEGRLNEHVKTELKNGLEGLENTLIEKMRDMQTEVRRRREERSGGHPRVLCR